MLRGRTSAVLATLLLAALTATGCGGSSSSGGPTTINWYVFNEPAGSFASAAAKCSKESNGALQDRAPGAADGRRPAARADRPPSRREGLEHRRDRHGRDLDRRVRRGRLDRAVDRAGLSRSPPKGCPAPLQTAKYKGKIWAAPFTTNTQLLFYRKDRVKRPPPKTWDQMIAQAVEDRPRAGQDPGAGRALRGPDRVVQLARRVRGRPILTNNGNTISLGAPASEGRRRSSRSSPSRRRRPGLENAKEDDGRLGFEAATRLRGQLPFV